MRRHPIDTFWKDVIDKEEFISLADEKNFKEIIIKKKLDDNSKNKNVPKCTDSTSTTSTTLTTTSATTTSAATTITTAAAVTATTTVSTTAAATVNISETDSDCALLKNDDCAMIDDLSKFKCQIDSADEELFCLGRNLGTRDYSGQRILQIATIMRNLSFIDENLPTLIKNKSFMRFVLLSCCSKWGPLQNLGIDMLGNMATEFIVKDTQTDLIGKCLINFIGELLKSEDRNLWITALEVLNKLSQNELNEDILSRCIEPCIYERACSFLTIQDVMLLIYTLECLYSLSSLGERPCNYIVSFHGVVDILVALVTVEGKSYGPKACIGMKLVETVPGGTILSTSSVTTSSTTSTTSAGSSTSTSTTISLTTSNISNISTKPTPLTPSRPVQIAPQRLIAVTPTTTATGKIIMKRQRNYYA